MQLSQSPESRKKHSGPASMGQASSAVSPELTAGSLEAGAADRQGPSWLSGFLDLRACAHLLFSKYVLITKGWSKAPQRTLVVYVSACISVCVCVSVCVSGWQGERWVERDFPDEPTGLRCPGALPLSVPLGRAVYPHSQGQVQRVLVEAPAATGLRCCHQPSGPKVKSRRLCTCRLWLLEEGGNGLLERLTFKVQLFCCCCSFNW